MKIPIVLMVRVGSQNYLKINNQTIQARNFEIC